MSVLGMQQEWILLVLHDHAMCFSGYFTLCWLRSGAVDWMSSNGWNTSSSVASFEINPASNSSMD